MASSPDFALRFKLFSFDFVLRSLDFTLSLDFCLFCLFSLFSIFFSRSLRVYYAILSLDASLETLLPDLWFFFLAFY